MAEIYVHTARDMGVVENSKGRKRYVIGHGLEQYHFTQLEWLVWKYVSTMSSIEQWREDMRAKIENKTKKTIEQIEETFLNTNVIIPWEFTDIDDPQLLNIYVTRNGYAYGAIQGSWWIAMPDFKEKFTLSEENYRIWVGASGQKLLVDIMEDLVEQYHYTEEQAFEAVIRKAKDFIRIGLWTAEYLDLEEEA